MKRLGLSALLALMTVLPAADAWAGKALFSDSFDRPDGALGRDWEATPFGVLPSIVSNRACVGPATEGVALYAGALDPASPMTATIQISATQLDSLKGGIIFASFAGAAPAYAQARLRETGVLEVETGVADGSPSVSQCSGAAVTLLANTSYQLSFQLDPNGAVYVQLYNANNSLLSSTSCNIGARTYDRMLVLSGRDVGTGSTCFDDLNLYGVAAPLPTATVGSATATATAPPPKPTATVPPATATATQVPPTATAIPPTATEVPPTATEVPPTATQVPATATATATATTAPGAFTVTSAVLSRGRDRSPNDNGRISVRARINDSDDLPARLVAGDFSVEVEDSDGSFHVTVPITGCALRSNGGATCRGQGAISSQVRLIAGEQAGQWLLRLQAFGFANSETGPTGTTSSTEAPVTITLREGSNDSPSIIDSCRPVGSTKLTCRGEGYAPVATATPTPAAIDCVVSAWSSWDACSKACGGGSQSRSRTVVTAAANGGAACPNLSETTACNEQPCPVDCVVSAWSSWDACSKACGGGSQSRSRTVVTAAANGGKACPGLSETTACNEQPCPVDCVVSAWSSWDACSKACGGGTQTRTRTVTQSAAYGGTPCPSLSEVTSCNEQPCP